MVNLLNGRWLSQVFSLIGLKPKARALQKLQIRIQGVPEFEIRLGEIVALRLWPDAQFDEVAKQIAASVPHCKCHDVDYFSEFPGTLKQWLLKQHNNDTSFVKKRLRKLSLVQIEGSTTSKEICGGDLRRIIRLAATPKGTNLVMFNMYGISPAGRVKFQKMFRVFFGTQVFAISFLIPSQKDDGSIACAATPDAIEVNSDWVLSRTTC